MLQGPGQAHPRILSEVVEEIADTLAEIFALSVFVGLGTVRYKTGTLLVRHCKSCCGPEANADLKVQFLQLTCQFIGRDQRQLNQNG